MLVREHAIWTQDSFHDHAAEVSDCPIVETHLANRECYRIHILV